MRRFALSVIGAGTFGLFAVGTALSAQGFSFLAGEWVAVGYGPDRGQKILIKSKMFGWEAWIPWWGKTMITPSGGAHGSHVKIEGDDAHGRIVCYYDINPRSPTEMSWLLKRGGSECPETSEFERTYDP